MSELLVAQCPFCQTRFRLSQEHLQAAAGNVRCGACLKVFNAKPAIAAEAQAPASTAPDSNPNTDYKPAAPQREPGRTTDRPNRSETLMIHDDLDLDNLDLEALGLDESILEEINPAGHSTDQPASGQPNQQEFRLELEPDSPEPEPEQRPENEAPAVSASSSLADDQEEEPDPWDMLDASETETDTDGELSVPAQGATSEHIDDDFDLHEDFLATPTARDFAPATLPRQSGPASDASSARSEPVRPVTDNGIYLRDRPAGAPMAVPPPSAVEPLQPAVPPEADEQRQEPQLGELIDLPDLVDEPVLLYEQPRKRRSPYRPVWIMLSILALLGLPAQALYYNYNTLAHGEQSRPYLEKMCFVLGCELPARVDIDLIRSSNLMVRPHPEYPNAMAIDVMLYNRAEFAQPFPVLRMTFNDTRGREVLTKRFRPDEYLGGELAGVTLMPPQTPVRVALDMLDPGPEAAGYQLDFLSP